MWRGLDWLDIVCRRGSNVISSPEVVVRTSLQQAIGGYRADLPHTADAEMWMRFAVHADVAYLQGVDQAFYRIHAAQMSTSRVPHVDLVHRKAAYDAIFDAYADRIPAADASAGSPTGRWPARRCWRACRAYERRRMDSTPIDELVEFAEGAYPRTVPPARVLGTALARHRRAAGLPVPPAADPLRGPQADPHAAHVAALGPRRASDAPADSTHSMQRRPSERPFFVRCSEAALRLDALGGRDGRLARRDRAGFALLGGGALLLPAGGAAEERALDQEPGQSPRSGA